LIVDDDKEIKKDIDCNCFDNMMDAKYEKVNPVNVAESHTHLSLEQQKDLATLLSTYDKLFDGSFS
jgi:hypothetical protein